MRILTVTHFFEEHGGGIERVAGQLCRAFLKQGDEVSWVASGAPSAGAGVALYPLRAWNGIERMTGLPMPLPSFGAIRVLWRAADDCDVLVVHDSLYVTSMLAVAAGWWKGKPVLLIQHVGELPFRNRLLRSAVALANRLIGRTMLHAADQAIFISQTTRDYFRDVRFRVPPLLLFNGVDTSIFHPGEPRARIGRSLLFVGRFVEKKGLATIEALARARPDLAITMAGQGPIDPDSWGLPNVTVCRGRSGASLANLYRAADVLLLPSVGEGYPLVIQEALACGLPVLCGEESARADPKATAFLTPLAIDVARPEENARRAAVAIDAMDLSEERRVAMAAYAERQYRWDGMARRIAEIAADLLRNGRACTLQSAEMRGT